jgi:hypothetical protein
MYNDIVPKTIVTKNKKQGLHREIERQYRFPRLNLVAYMIS